MTLHFEELQSAILYPYGQKKWRQNYWKFGPKRHWHKLRNVTWNGSPNNQNRRTAQNRFANFLEGLQKKINPSISENQAIEMLSQHIITNLFLKHCLKDILL
jgi:predicted helicase